MNPLFIIQTVAKRVTLLMLLCLPISGCAATVGQEFRDIMADIDAQCRRDHQGPYYDATIPNHPRYGDCDILSIKPADPLATEEGRFAYSIKLPEPYNKSNVQYHKGMSAESYFKELCEKAEGDFVFRTVAGVDGIKIMRPQPQVGSTPLWEEYGWLSSGQFVSRINSIYEYVDAVELVEGSQTDTQLVHYAIDSKLSPKAPLWGMAHYPIKESEARYGYTFRKSPLENRELGIVGDEIIILDLKANEVLGFRRRFSRLNFITKQSVQLMQGTPCRLLHTEDSNNRFVAKILKPATLQGDKK